MGFLLEFDYEFGGLRFWLSWLLGFDEDDDENEVFLLDLFLFVLIFLPPIGFTGFFYWVCFGVFL